MKKFVSLALDPELKVQLREYAKQQDRTLHNMILYLVKRGLQAELSQPTPAATAPTQEA